MPFQLRYMRIIILYIFLISSISGLTQDDSIKAKNNNIKVSSFKSIKVEANAELAGNKWKKLLVGENYRREWTQPVTVPIIDLKKSGLTPKKEGGGKQTKSLQVEDENGQKYKLRSIRKNPEKVVPPAFRNTIVQELFSDGISASYPYGALSTGIFSQAMGIPYLRQKLVYVGDDPQLGEFQSKYKNTLAYFEDQVPANIRSTEKKDEFKSLSTLELLDKIQDKHTNRVDQLEVLRVRLLDNFLMDFDRHEGQWEWGKVESSGHHIFYAVPKDRDQVFFKADGLLMRFLAKRGRVPEFHGLSSRVKDIEAYNNAARNFDRTFLTNISKEDWSSEIDHLLNAMTDNVIESAMAQQPKEIQNYAAPGIVNTLKQKRSFFKEEMLHYYDALAKVVSVVGSNEREEFVITSGDRKTIVTMFGLDSLGDHSTGELYHREFDASVTKEIQLYGLEGDDRFAITGNSPIKIRMIGGPGKDQFINTGDASNAIAYDLKAEDNTFSKGIRNRSSNDPMVNEYRRMGYKFDLFSITPTLELGASQGLFLGAAMKITKYGFRKDPYSSLHLLSFTHSVSSSSMHIKYNADFIKTLGKTDLLIRSDFSWPTLKTNYFGTGNETSIDKAQFTAGYYHARYDLANAAVLARNKLGRFTTLSYGPSFQYLQLKDAENISHLVHSYLPPANHSNEYNKNYFAGGETNFMLDTRNDKWFPTLGVVLNTFGRVLYGLNSSAPNVGFTGGNFKFFKDLSSTGALMLISDFGGAHTFGNYLFEQSQFLGYKDHLRGYRLQRFAGRTSAYNNTELRIRIANLKTYIMPATVGVFGFNDIGRVWADGEKSNKWHDGYGAGIWLAPINKILFSAFLAFSNEEKALPFVNIGFAL